MVAYAGTGSQAEVSYPRGRVESYEANGPLYATAFNFSLEYKLTIKQVEHTPQGQSRLLLSPKTNKKGPDAKTSRPSWRAPRVGFEPTTLRLTAACSTIELRRTRRGLTRTVRRIYVEAEAGIEPTYTDLQSAASPLCHSAPGLMRFLANRGAPPFAVRGRAIASIPGWRERAL